MLMIPISKKEAKNYYFDVSDYIESEKILKLKSKIYFNAFREISGVEESGVFVKYDRTTNKEEVFQFYIKDDSGILGIKRFPESFDIFETFSDLFKGRVYILMSINEGKTIFRIEE